MVIRDAISFILGNIQIPLFVIAVIVSVVKLRRASARHEVMSTAYTLWGEVLFYCFGLGMIYVWYFHAFQSAMVAPLIGWQPSPFEWELAWSELGMGVVAVLALWRGYEMRLAATLVPAIFLFGGPKRGDRPQRLRLQHGDVVVWGGPARLFFHGVAPLAAGEHAAFGRCRINLTFRRAR